MTQRHPNSFADRTWAVRRIADWLRSDGRALVVTGAAGTGKTTLVHSVATGRYDSVDVHAFGAIHRCQAHVCASTDPLRVLADIASQLTRTVPGYRVGVFNSATRPQDGEDPVQMAARLVLDSPSPAVAYDRALRVPLTALAGIGNIRRGQDVVVVVDGLDETLASSPGAGLVDLFSEALATPMPGLRLLLTVRSGAALARLRPANILNLVSDQPPGVDDVRAYLETVETLPARWRSAIAEAADSCFVYADLAARLATDKGLPDWQPPAGLPALYDDALAHVGAPDSLPRLVLSVLGRARDAGFTTDQLSAVLGRHRQEVAEAVKAARHLLTGDRKLRLHHRCLSEHLWATTPVPGVEDWIIAQHLRREGHGRWLADREPYGLRNVLLHLGDAASVEYSPVHAAIQDMLTDPSYLIAAVLGVGVDDLLDALTYIDQRADGQAGAGTLLRVLRRQATPLRLARRCDDAGLVAQQIVYEAATTGATDLARQFSGQVPDTAILTLWATADSPLQWLPDAIRGHGARVTSVVVTHDGTRAFTTSDDHNSKVWRLGSGRVAHTVPIAASVSNMYAEPGTAFVVASTTDGRVQILDADAGHTVAELPTEKSALVTAFATNGDGSIGVGGDLDGNVAVWDLGSGEQLLKMAGTNALIAAVAVSPDARIAATAALDGEIVIWDLLTGAARTRFNSGARVHALALTPSASRLLVGTEDLSVYTLAGSAPPRLLAGLTTATTVTALTVNPAMPSYALLGGASGQVAYVRLPVADRAQ